MRCGQRVKVDTIKALHEMVVKTKSLRHESKAHEYTHTHTHTHTYTQQVHVVIVLPSQTRTRNSSHVPQSHTPFTCLQWHHMLEGCTGTHWGRILMEWSGEEDNHFVKYNPNQGFRHTNTHTHKYTHTHTHTHTPIHSNIPPPTHVEHSQPELAP